mmetsp:Transcript_150772/g.465256  ORF Transcript_150772/g.465256 Transcript_150772/m.465256 type:complete len:269 (-) Transcript_150772:483-1289(-)
MPRVHLPRLCLLRLLADPGAGLAPGGRRVGRGCHCRGPSHVLQVLLRGALGARARGEGRQQAEEQQGQGRERGAHPHRASGAGRAHLPARGVLPRGVQRGLLGVGLRALPAGAAPHPRRCGARLRPAAVREAWGQRWLWQPAKEHALGHHQDRLEDLHCGDPDERAVLVARHGSRDEDRAADLAFRLVRRHILPPGAQPARRGEQRMAGAGLHAADARRVPQQHHRSVTPLHAHVLRGHDGSRAGPLLLLPPAGSPDSYAPHGGRGRR